MKYLMWNLFLFVKYFNKYLSNLLDSLLDFEGTNEDDGALASSCISCYSS